jgi:hypothetical protein
MPPREKRSVASDPPPTKIRHSAFDAIGAAQRTKLEKLNERRGGGLR